MRQTEDTTERDALITSSIPVVTHIVRETMGRVPSHVSRDDLTSAGLTALVQASKSYDESRGVPFARYAATRVRGAVLDELRGIDWASRSVRRRARDLDATRSQLAGILGRVPSAGEVAQAAGLTLTEIAQNDEDIARAQVLSLQGAQDSSLDDVLPAAGPTPEQLVEHRERLAYLVEAVAELPDRLRIVVSDYFLEERPMADIAAELGVSESRVSQMRAEALVLLRDALNHELDPSRLTPHARPNGSAARRRDAYFAAVASRHAVSTRRPAGVRSLDETA
ncbi:sigma-70 family RNA polymerase sigma factor [Nocardioides marmoriginsengisoli]|uniref:Sigma-70 family RNA polymerase sigma factor n=1 Tax=Nocardioides marmoriginsengisoli TaxID=661483 RepID=A0A3N0CCS5_9ACTN|nr:sigma-70 family RNA polymerase sigma factor [Nocardioides marmoriginsengisoli]RNL61041.1 sigma-70 family RNA polymerase sigma factor [Nocardioides marmoriginsengisoli]